MVDTDDEVIAVPYDRAFYKTFNDSELNIYTRMHDLFYCGGAQIQKQLAKIIVYSDSL